MVTASNWGVMTDVDPIATFINVMAMPEMWNSGAAAVPHFAGPNAIVDEHVHDHVFDHPLRLHHALGHAGRAGRECEAEKVLVVGHDVGLGLAPARDEIVVGDPTRRFPRPDRLANGCDGVGDLVGHGPIPLAVEDGNDTSAVTLRDQLRSGQAIVEGDVRGPQLHRREHRLDVLGRIDGQDSQSVATFHAAGAK